MSKPTEDQIEVCARYLCIEDGHKDSSALMPVSKRPLWEAYREDAEDQLSNTRNFKP